MIRIGIAAMTVFLVAFPALAGSKSPSLALSPAQDVLHRAGSPGKDGGAGLRVWTGRKGEPYRSGEKLVLYVRSDRDAWITVLDTGTSGKTHVIFPNRYEPNHFLPAFTTLQIPGKGKKYHIGVGGPAGAELLKVFASTTKAPLFPASMLEKAGPYQHVSASSKDIAGAISQKMKARSKSPSLSNLLTNRQEKESWTEHKSQNRTVYSNVDLVIQILGTAR